MENCSLHHLSPNPPIDHNHNNNNNKTVTLSLPPELLMQCFQHMNYMQAQSMARVNTQFKHLICSADLTNYFSGDSAKKLIFIAFDAVQTLSNAIHSMPNFTTIQVYRNQLTGSLEADYLHPNAVNTQNYENLQPLWSLGNSNGGKKSLHVPKTNVTNHDQNNSILMGSLTSTKKHITAHDRAITITTYEISPELRNRLTHKESVLMEDALKNTFEIERQQALAKYKRNTIVNAKSCNFDLTPYINKLGEQGIDWDKI